MSYEDEYLEMPDPTEDTRPFGDALRWEEEQVARDMALEREAEARETGEDAVAHLRNALQVCDGLRECAWGLEPAQVVADIIAIRDRVSAALRLIERA